jgi:hypothetical protein
MAMSADNRTRWAALAVVCARPVMNMPDTTIAGVKPPAIRRDLDDSQGSTPAGVAR